MEKKTSHIHSLSKVQKKSAWQRTRVALSQSSFCQVNSSTIIKFYLFCAICFMYIYQNYINKHIVQFMNGVDASTLITPKTLHKTKRKIELLLRSIRNRSYE